MLMCVLWPDSEMIKTDISPAVRDIKNIPGCDERLRFVLQVPAGPLDL